MRLNSVHQEQASIPKATSFMKLCGVFGLWLLCGALPAYGTTPHINVTAHRIASFDGIQLQGTLYEPDYGTGDAPFPAVLLVNPWALPAGIYAHQAKKLAESGMVVLSYTVRGFGWSEGEVSVAGPSDTEDMSTWIDWLIANTHTDPERIGAAGISLGAGIVLVSAAHDERIKAVCSLSGWTDLYSSLYNHQTAPRLWGDLLVLSGKTLGRVEYTAESIFKRVQRYDISQQELHAWADPRSAMTYLDVYEARALPIYMQHNIGDNLFEVNQAIDFYQRLHSPKKLDLNYGEHITSELLTLIGVNQPVWDRVIAWFGLYLAERPSPLLNEGRTAFPVHRSSRPVHSNSWPRTDSMSLHLAPQEKLTDAPVTSETSATKTIKHAWLLDASSGIPILSAAIEAHTGLPAVALRQLMLRDRVAIFEAPKLFSAKTLVGAPKVDLWISSKSPKLQLVAYLYSVNALGMAYPISYGAYTIHDSTSAAPQKISFEMKFASYEAPRGSHLMLAVDTFDPYYVDPNPTKYTVDLLFAGDGYDARINLPYLSER